MDAILVLSVFFFQAEDGIRDYKVTGVQTCALPISSRQARAASGAEVLTTEAASASASAARRSGATTRLTSPSRRASSAPSPSPASIEIGRASCRERVGRAGAAVSGETRSVG